MLDTTFLEVARYMEFKRQRWLPWRSKKHTADDEIYTLFPDLIVKHGCFKGMKYPEAKAICSALFPKLIGSYEKEIQPILEKICREGYTEIVDIGCAEGYYAVGLAMRIPTAKIFAYDTNKDAIRLCKRMADLNNVGKRITAGSFCSVETLKSIPFMTKGLIISDCEGYEKKLFVEDTVPFIASCDLLIEIHDYIDINISSLIRQRFAETHEVEIIRSIDDIDKAKSYFYEELTGFDLESRKILLGECRPTIMEWFYMKSRS